MAVLVYVDDSIVTSPNVATASTMKASLSSKFKLKDLGLSSFFLASRLSALRLVSFFNNDNIPCNYLEDFGFLSSKPKTPMDPRVALHRHDGDPIFDPTSYQHLVGCLLYLTIMRLDCYI